ncbi:MAG: DUF1565 domain-containing protein [Pseudanabaenaceae cyanobacterium]
MVSSPLTIQNQDQFTHPMPNAPKSPSSKGIFRLVGNLVMVSGSIIGLGIVASGLTGFGEPLQPVYAQQTNPDAVLGSNKDAKSKDILRNSIAKSTTGKNIKNIIFVAPAVTVSDRPTGNNPQPVANEDQITLGTAQQPYTSITAALRAANSGTIIQLQPGRYDANSGESFPLNIPAGVTLRGNTDDQGRSVVIIGGGTFNSAVLGPRSVAVVMGNNSRLEGVTVGNQSPNGFGVWLESVQNVVIQQSFLRYNQQDAIVLVGNAKAMITRNAFSENLRHGIWAMGTSQGDIFQNVFDDTGIGLNLSENAEILLTSNRISNNLDGVMISQNARVVMRRNQIFSNQRYGVAVLTKQGQTPDLGTSNHLGRNRIRGNNEFDIISLNRDPIPAAGNELNLPKVRANLNVNAPTTIRRLTGNTVATATTGAPKSRILNPETNPETNPDNNPETNSSPEFRPIDRRHLRPQIARLSERKPQPTGPIDPLTGRPIQFKVIVPLENGMTAEQLRQNFPNAFRTIWDRQIVMQVGAFSEGEDAEKLTETLSASGINADIVRYR